MSNDAILTTNAILKIYNKYKIKILYIFSTLAVGLLVYGIYIYIQSIKTKEYDVLITTFNNQKLQNFIEAPNNYSQIAKSIISLSKETNNYTGIIPIVLRVSKVMIKNKKLNDAYLLLSYSYKNYKNSNYISYILAMRLAVVAENLEKLNESITYLRHMESSPINFMKSKIYIDLGRVYNKLGNNTKARLSFNEAVKLNESPYSRLAELYLQKIQDNK